MPQVRRTQKRVKILIVMIVVIVILLRSWMLVTMRVRRIGQPRKCQLMSPDPRRMRVEMPRAKIELCHCNHRPGVERDGRVTSLGMTDDFFC